MNCLGCGRNIGWDGKGRFCYTCGCGATVFVGDHGLALPASLGMAIARGNLVVSMAQQKNLAHLDYYVGVSAHDSEQKRDFIRALRARGHTWSWECAECRGKRCPFRWQCPRFNSPAPDDRAVTREICVTVRHQDCTHYQELRNQVAAIERSPGEKSV